MKRAASWTNEAGGSQQISCKGDEELYCNCNRSSGLVKHQDKSVKRLLSAKVSELRMKVLVTGSSGFIGQALMRRLGAQGCEVAGLDKAPRSPQRIMSATSSMPDRLKRAVARFFAGCALSIWPRAPTSTKKPIWPATPPTSTGVQNLIAASARTPSIRRAIWTSSQLVCRVGYVPRNDTDYAADTLYGQSKIRTEQIVRRGGRRRNANGAWSARRRSGAPE